MQGETYDKGVNEEFNEKQISQTLIGVRERDQQASRPTVDVQSRRTALGQRLLFEELHLLPIHTNHEHASNEGAKDLREDVVRNFLPWEALPDSETNRDGGVEMAS